MKKSLILLIATITVYSFIGCKSETKKESPEIKKEEKSTDKGIFSLKEAKNKIVFTAYKTTEKIPVKGEFKKVNILSGGEGNSIKDAVNNTEFSIPVSSLFTKDSSRDFKIKKFFFGIMDKTELLSGKLMIETDSTGVASILMNGVTNRVPFTYSITGKNFFMDATMDITKWNADAALEALNEACKDLHKGADGVSKTWSDVALKVVTIF